MKMLCNIIALGIFGLACVSDRLGLEQRIDDSWAKMQAKSKSYRDKNVLHDTNFDGNKNRKTYEIIEKSK